MESSSVQTKRPGKSAKSPVTSKVFDAAYAKLNVAQKEAVDSIEGPVMVIAGPGTGKTQVLALRAANILRKTQMRPSNILCLTFSVSGAKAMRERLRSIIGPDAYGITVNTIHGFCNDIILQYPQVFEEFRALKQVTDIESLRIVRRQLKELPTGSVLNRPTIERDRAADILSRITEMKREGIDAEQLQKHAKTYAKEIELTPKGKERDKTTKAYKDDMRKVKQLSEFIEVYEGYNRALQDLHRYDYADMILHCSKALQEEDWLLALLQERYQYVLVDEYQDTNGAQNRFLELLTTYPGLDHDPNLFVVGDDDQAIYRFQGANIGNMLSLLKRLPKTHIVTLTENYRSTQPILDAAGKVITENEQRLSNSIENVVKDIHATTKESGESPIFLRFPSTELEHAGIAEQLTKAHSDGIEWNDMAVLCRTNQEVLDLHTSLSSADIPTVLAAKNDLLTHGAVLQAIAIMRAAVSPDDDVVLSDAIGAQCFGCAPTDLGRMWVSLRKRNMSREKGEPYMSLREYALNEELSSEVQAAVECIEHLHAIQGTTTVPELLQELLERSSLLPSKDEQNMDPQVLAGLHAFYDYAKTRCYEQNTLTLRELLADIDQYIEEPSLKLQYEVPHLTADGVQLMTAHAAKGLEFSVVVLPQVRFRNWGNRLSNTRFALPDHLLYDTDASVEKTASQEDERRVFFVALTRAKRKLITSFSESYRTGEDVRDAQVSSFIAEAAETIDEYSVPAKDIPKPIETLYRSELNIDEAFTAFLQERIADFELSVTALNVFLKDPKEFLWTQLLMRPQAKMPHLSYGSAVHAALEEQNLAWKEGKDFSESDLLNTFHESMDDYEIFTEENRKLYTHIGDLVLQRYYELSPKASYPILYAEKTLKAHMGDIPLKGKVDRIDLLHENGSDCRIVDYKTGVPKKTEESVRKDEGLFRQLVFYKLLSNLSSSFPYNTQVCTLDFVGNEKEDRRIIDVSITEQEVDDLRSLIQAVWSKITALDFTPIE